MVRIDGPSVFCKSNTQKDRYFNLTKIEKKQDKDKYSMQ
jgi:hypothetical protein